MNIRMHNKPDLVLLNISVHAVSEDWRNAEGICIGYVCVWFFEAHSYPCFLVCMNMSLQQEFPPLWSLESQTSSSLAARSNTFLSFSQNKGEPVEWCTVRVSAHNAFMQILPTVLSEETGSSFKHVSLSLDLVVMVMHFLSILWQTQTSLTLRSPSFILLL